MARQLSLESTQVAGILIQAIEKSKQTFQDSLETPKMPDGFKTATFGRVVKIRDIVLGDRFGAVDIVFKHDGKKYLLTVEQTIDGDYCSAFDPNYRHTARELRTARKRYE